MDEFDSSGGSLPEIGLEALSRQAHRIDAEQIAATPVIRLERDSECLGVAYFLDDHQEHDAVGLVIGGIHAGYLERMDLPRLFGAFGGAGAGALAGAGAGGGGGIGVGGSAGAGQRGLVPAGDFQSFELKCPVQGCPDNPIFAFSFDPESPPHCSRHGDQPLSLVG